MLLLEWKKVWSVVYVRQTQDWFLVFPILDPSSLMYASKCKSFFMCQSYVLGSGMIKPLQMMLRCSNSIVAVQECQSWILYMGYNSYFLLWLIPEMSSIFFLENTLLFNKDSYKQKNNTNCTHNNTTQSPNMHTFRYTLPLLQLTIFRQTKLISKKCLLSKFVCKFKTWIQGKHLLKKKC